MQEILDAWNIEGPNPEYHRRMKDWVRVNWPTLGDALDNASNNMERE